MGNPGTVAGLNMGENEMRIFDLIRLKRAGFEEWYREVWIAGDYCRYKGGREAYPWLMPYFDLATEHGDYVQHKVGDVVPLRSFGDRVFFFRIEAINLYGSPVGDYAGWDDRKQYDLRFHSIRKMSAAQIEWLLRRVTYKPRLLNPETV